MIQAIGAVLRFVITFLGINIGQKYFQLRYSTHWWFFVAFFVLGLTIPPFLSSYHHLYLFDPTGLTVGFIAVLLFVLLEFWRGNIIPASEYFGGDQLPEGYEPLLKPSGASTLVKLFDVFFQDVILLTIVFGLLSRLDLTTTSCVIAITVFLLHIPGVYFFGRVYGLTFLVLSTIFVLFVPYILSTASHGFYVLFGVHLLVYPLVMLLYHFVYVRNV